MIRRLAVGLAVVVLVGVLPAVGNPGMYAAPQLWILVAVGVLASVLQPGYNPVTITAKDRDRGTAAQIIWSVYVTQLAAILEACYLRYPDSVRWDALAWIALAVMLAGLALRTWAVFALGRLFTMHIAVHEGHSLVRSGPFAFVRHPSYLGALVLYVSTAIFVHSWFAAAAAAVVLPAAFLRRMRHEEALLREEFGAEYDAYCAEVKKFIPWAW